VRPISLFHPVSCNGQTVPEPQKGRNASSLKTQRADFKHTLATYMFDARRQFRYRVEVLGGKVELPLTADAIDRVRVFMATMEAKMDV